VGKTTGQHQLRSLAGVLPDRLYLIYHLWQRSAGSRAGRHGRSETRHFHFAYGFSRAAVTWGLVASGRHLKAVRCLAGAFGSILWALTLRILARFAIGRALIW